VGEPPASEPNACEPVLTVSLHRNSFCSCAECAPSTLAVRGPESAMDTRGLATVSRADIDPRMACWPLGADHSEPAAAVALEEAGAVSGNSDDRIELRWLAGEAGVGFVMAVACLS
jgi:hypothetical protein